MRWPRPPGIPGNLHELRVWRTGWVAKMAYRQTTTVYMYSLTYISVIIADVIVDTAVIEELHIQPDMIQAYTCRIK